MKHLLLVDDDDAILESLQLLLEDSYKVSLARHGAEALDRLEREPFDAILLDLMMPVMDGEALVRELKRRGIAVPIVIGSAGANVRERAEQLEAMDWIRKPYDIEALEGKLARASAGGQVPA